ncbi:MAG TPA: TonB family protein [Bryobacteraceae bacterium]
MRAQLIPSILVVIALGDAADAQFKEIGPPPLSLPAARERIKTLLAKVDPGNRQETIKTLSDFAVWYRDLLDEELIASWKKGDRAKLTGLMAPLADSPVAVGVVEFSWRQARQATFSPDYEPTLEDLMYRYPDSVKPFLDDLLAFASTGRPALDLSPPEAETVCRILLDLPDIRTWKKGALQILPHYREVTQALLDRDLRGDNQAKRDQATVWLADLKKADPAFDLRASAADTPHQLLQPEPARNVRNPSSVPRVANTRPTILSAPTSPGETTASGVYQVGNGVSPPTVVSHQEPEYAELARKLSIEGWVTVSMIIQPDGTATNFRITKSVGYGLDEKAIEAVRKWRFKPGLKDGAPVPVMASVEVNFRLPPRPPDHWYFSGPILFAPEAGLKPPVLKDATVPADPAGDGSKDRLTFEFTVNSKGSVKNVRFVDGPTSLAQMFSRSLATWKFQPAMKDNRPVEAMGRVTFVKGLGDQAVSASPALPPLSGAPAAGRAP